MNVEPLHAFQLYSSLKLHFGEKGYDFFKYGLSKNRFNIERYQNRNDRYMYEKLGKKFNSPKELMMFLACNFMYNKGNVWIGDLLDNFDTCERVHNEFKGYFGAPCRHYLEDLKKIYETRGNRDMVWHIDEPDDVPWTYQLLYKKKIAPQTLVLANRFLEVDFIGKILDNTSSIMPTYQISSCLQKFSPFVTLRDTDELNNIQRLSNAVKLKYIAHTN